MVSAIRKLSRLVSVVLLSALLAPSALAECRPIDGVPQQGMDCCHKTVKAAGASLDADCCALTPDVPAPAQPTTAAATVRTADPFLSAHATVAEIAVVLPAVAIAPAARDTGPPSDPLYLRLSTIRR